MIKRRLKIAVDILMVFGFLLLMEYHLLPEVIHEWLGISVFVLFAVHNALNYKWFLRLFRGRYTAMRMVRTVLNFLLFASMLLCVIGALFVSREVFAGLNLRSGMIGRILHMKASAWTFVFICFHLGFHLTGGRIKKRLKISGNRIVKWILRGIVLIASVYGIVVFMQRGFYEELFIPEVFKGNFTEKNPAAAFIFFIQTMAMAIPFISLAYYMKKLGFTIQKLNKEKQSEKAI